MWVSVLLALELISLTFGIVIDAVSSESIFGAISSTSLDPKTIEVMVPSASATDLVFLFLTGKLPLGNILSIFHLNMVGLFTFFPLQNDNCKLWNLHLVLCQLFWKNRILVIISSLPLTNEYWNLSYSSKQFIIVIYSAIELSRRVSTLLKGLIRRKKSHI